MATIATLNIMLTANTAKLGKDLDKAVGMFGDIKSKITGLFAGAAAFGVLDSFFNTAEEIDKLAKLGDRLGLTTQQIMQLQHAADLSGVENLEGGLTILAAKLGEAETEGSAAAKMFADLGMDGAALSKSGVMEALEQIADKLRFFSETRRTNALRDIFGKSGAGLSAMLSDARSLRAAMAEISGVNRESAARVEEFNDNVTRLKAGWTELKRIIVTEAVGMDAESLERKIKPTLFPSVRENQGQFEGVKSSLDGIAAKVKEIRINEEAIAAAAKKWKETQEKHFKDMQTLEAGFPLLRPGVPLGNRFGLDQMEEQRKAMEDEAKKAAELREDMAQKIFGMLGAGGGDVKTAGAAAAGSAEALSIMARAQTRAMVGGGKGSEADRITRAIDAHKKETAESKRILEKIRERLDKDKALVLPAG